MDQIKQRINDLGSDNIFSKGAAAQDLCLLSSQGSENQDTIRKFGGIAVLIACLEKERHLATRQDII